MNRTVQYCICEMATYQPTSVSHVPRLQTVLVVNGDQVLSKWQQNLHLSLMAEVCIHLLAPLEGLHDCPISSKQQLALQSQALQWVGLNLT